MAAGGILKEWRAYLLGALLMGFLLLVVVALTDERSQHDQLPLRGVPDTAYANAGVVLDPAYLDTPWGRTASFGPKGAEFLAEQLICCGKPAQTVLVGLREVNGDGFVLSYALNYDTSKGPKDIPIGGHWATRFMRDFDYFVAFIDAKTGHLIYRLQPGYQDPFPSAGQQTAPAAGPIVARNLDGPNVFVSLWTFGPETTVVECGEEKVVTTTQESSGPWYVAVNDASNGKLLFERHLPAGPKWILSIRHDGIVIGEQMISSGPSSPNIPCR